ncbi:MAG: cyclic nucleotide-binding domain-containing protein [Thermoplasmata archaeon]|nr:cyclic nucleotide-binding domain-containing protein [Thermoplasmata archaeon]
MPRTVEFPTNQLAERLGHVSILGSLSQRQLKKLAGWVKIVAYAEGETMVKRGEGGIGLFLILDGAAEVRRGSRGLAKLGVGQFFGEMTLFDDLPRSADVVATKASKVAVLSRFEFWGFAESEPKILRGVLEEMTRRLRETNQALSE